MPKNKHPEKLGISNASQLKKTAGKPVSASEVIMTEMVLPQDTNALGSVFGGRVMALIDIAAAMSAGKHSRALVVTASIDALHFISPVSLGEYIHIKASVNYVGQTSMEVGVRVDGENPLTGKIRHTASAYLTFVALNEARKPIPVPPLILENDDQKRRFKEAQHRKAARLELAKKLKKING